MKHTTVRKLNKLYNDSLSIAEALILSFLYACIGIIGLTSLFGLIILITLEITK